MSIRLWPKDYERKEHITKAEKVLLRNAERNLTDGHLVVGINPCGLSTDRRKMAFYLSPTEGLVTITLITEPFQEKDIEIHLASAKIVESTIQNRLLEFKALIVRNAANLKSLKFPYKHILMFSNEKSINVSDDIYHKLEGYITANFFLPVNFASQIRHVSDLSIFKNIHVPYDENFTEISELESRAIFEALAPEYTIVLREKENIVVKETKFIPRSALQITGSESEYKTFLLDEYQVGLVNEMGTGHRVILANPGAGKSVLLLSKAFKYASVYKDSQVLLTCYNNNLADAYKFKQGCANFGKVQNLHIMTFHKLVKELYSDCLGKRCETNIPTEQEIQDCISYIKDGKIDLKFKAIFIDEVQIFEPHYLELCYLLLDTQDPNHLFLMAGDLNQTVRTLSRRGDAPWKKINGVKLDFTGRVRYIEKNYRNSRVIGEYLNQMLRRMNTSLDMLHLISPKEFEYNSFEISNNESVALEIRLGLSRYDIKEAVINAVHEIVEKYNISYADIAILFPYTQHSSLKYYIHYWIKQGLDDAGIPYSDIITTGGNMKIQYSASTGVVLSTIDSSLGLDFKAVILTGLSPYDYVFAKNKIKISSWKMINALSEENKEAVQIQMRKIYTACSRAREILYVLSDLTPKTPMEKLLEYEVKL